MPQLISDLGHCRHFAGYDALNRYARGSTAISPEAAETRKAASYVVASAEQSQALFGKKARSISRLIGMAYQCSEQAYGDEAEGLNPEAITQTANFIRALPDNFPVPEFAPEPDGSISLDWIVSQRRMLSISISGSSRLAYAWVDEADRGHGIAQFDGEVVPSRILEDVRQIMDHECASFRPA
jgi:hypothetical protein